MVKICHLTSSNISSVNTADIFIEFNSLFCLLLCIKILCVDTMPLLRIGNKTPMEGVTETKFGAEMKGWTMQRVPYPGIHPIISIQTPTPLHTLARFCCEEIDFELGKAVGESRRSLPSHPQRRLRFAWDELGTGGKQMQLGRRA